MRRPVSRAAREALGDAEFRVWGGGGEDPGVVAWHVGPLAVRCGRLG